MVGGQDSIVLNPASGLAKFVVYINSDVCSSCHLKQMIEYAEVIDFCKEMGESYLPIFIFSPSQVKMGEVIQTLKSTRFDYPILLDEKGLFPAANPHIPADKRFHTFLLDRNGKVVLVGDPLHNPQLWELYKTTITRLIENGGTLPLPEKQD